MRPSVIANAQFSISCSRCGTAATADNGHLAAENQLNSLTFLAARRVEGWLCPTNPPAPPLCPTCNNVVAP